MNIENITAIALLGGYRPHTHETESRSLTSTEALFEILAGDPDVTADFALFRLIESHFNRANSWTSAQMDHTCGPGRSMVQRREARTGLFVWRVVLHTRRDPSKRWNSPINRGCGNAWGGETIAVGIADSMDEATKLGRAEATRAAKERAEKVTP